MCVYTSLSWRPAAPHTPATGRLPPPRSPAAWGAPPPRPHLNKRRPISFSIQSNKCETPIYIYTHLHIKGSASAYMYLQVVHVLK